MVQDLMIVSFLTGPPASIKGTVQHLCNQPSVLSLLRGRRSEGHAFHVFKSNTQVVSEHG